MRQIVHFFILGIGAAIGVISLHGLQANNAALNKAVIQQGNRTQAMLLAQKLLAAYPEQRMHIDSSVSSLSVVFPRGTHLSLGPCRSIANNEEWYDDATLCDQLSVPYLRGKCTLPSSDAGRARCRDFFTAMYGSDEKSVRKNCTALRWIDGRTLLFSRINSVDKHIRQLIRELSTLPDSMQKYLREPGGSLVWRQVAGTNRLSAHSFGIALDINVRQSHYWRNHSTIGTPSYRNRIPFEIVELFERHGFIWGGKWIHFDTMHFEFRPELCLPHCNCTTSSSDE